MEEFKLEWNSNYNIGIPSIDVQHQKLFKLLKNLASAFLLNKEKNIITNILFELEDYTKYHFKEEEDLFLTRKKKKNERHFEQHRDFERTLHNLKFDYVSVDKPISLELITYLRDWLQGHILGVDQEDLNYIGKN